MDETDICKVLKLFFANPWNVDYLVRRIGLVGGEGDEFICTVNVSNSVGLYKLSDSKS